MKVNKLFGVKSITNLIYGCLLMIPFVSILSRVIYVQSNDNAKDSYSAQILETQTNYPQGSTLLPGVMYYMAYNGVEQFNYNSGYIDVLDGKSNIQELFFPNEVWTISRFSITYEDVRSRLIIYDTNGRQHNLFNFWTISNETIYFVNKNNFTLSTLNTMYVTIYSNTYKTLELDNAFEYSLKTFTDENNVDSIDFFGWFTNLFLNQDNPHNQIYLGFANWYMNYTLLVSSGYLLFFALLWFVNYVRRILEKSSYHDFGGF